MFNDEQPEARFHNYKKLWLIKIQLPDKNNLQLVTFFWISPTLNLHLKILTGS